MAVKGFSYEAGSKERARLLKGLVPLHERAGPEPSARSCTVSRVKGVRVIPADEWRLFSAQFGWYHGLFPSHEGRQESFYFSQN